MEMCAYIMLLLLTYRWPPFCQGHLKDGANSWVSIIASRFVFTDDYNRINVTQWGLPMLLSLFSGYISSHYSNIV